MLDYKMATVNLAPAWRPGLGSPVIPHRPMLSAGGPMLSANGVPGAVLGAGIGTLALGTAFSAGTAWVGFSTASREKGFLSGLGFVVGTISTLMALGGMASLAILGVMGVTARKGTVPETPAPTSALPTTTSPWVSTDQLV